jgi:hypothetical protein
MRQRPDQDLTPRDLDVLAELIALHDAADGDRAVRSWQLSSEVGYVDRDHAVQCLIHAGVVSEYRGLRADTGFVEAVLHVDRPAACASLLRHGRRSPQEPAPTLPAGVRSRPSTFAGS